MKPLTPTMIAAIEFAKEHDNKLIRHQGGFWSDVNWNSGREYYGTTTAEALVARGYATYTQWKENKFGKFPIEATLTDKTF